MARAERGQDVYDAIFVGAGIGSLVAAIRFSERGLRPLIVEKSSLVGGASAYSGGVVWAPANHRMRAKGISDSIAEGLDYLESVSRGRWHPDVARAYVESVGWILEWLEAATPVRWMSYPDLPDYFAERAGGKPAGRCLLPQPTVAEAFLAAAVRDQPELELVRESVHFPDERHRWAAGRALVGCLWSKVVELGTPYLLDTHAVRLSRADGVVAGVEVHTSEGPRTLRSRLGVLLNTGGFEWNGDLTRDLVPGGHEVHPQTPPTGEGDGHVMAVELGAAVALMDQTISTPALRVPGEDNEGHQLYRLFFQELTYAHSVVVNSDGTRFANETFFPDIARGWSEFDLRTVAHPNLPMYFVFDDQYRRIYGLPAGIDVDGYLSRHDDLRALASARGIDPDGLERQIDRFNADVRAGSDTEFGRGATAYQRVFAAEWEQAENPTIGPIEQPPFYCVELFPATSGHRGGLVTDARGRVLDVRGAWLGGLYACGSAAAGLVTGGTYLTGASVGQAIVFGVLAADAMAAAASEQRADFDEFVGNTGHGQWSEGEES